MHLTSICTRNNVCQGVSRPSLPQRGMYLSKNVTIRPRGLGYVPASKRVLVPPTHAAQTDQKQAWDSQVADGRVRNISAQDVKSMQADGWLVLDVRPPYETVKAPITKAVHVPLFVEDPDNGIGTLVKKATDFGMGGWWLGGTHNVPNTDFSTEVRAKLPSDSRVIVVCQKGLRSLAACETLARLGFSNVAWVNGGLDTARKGDIDTDNGVDVRYGGLGGLSEVLGWTEVQREEGKGEALGGLKGIISFFAVVLAADLLLFAYEQVMYLNEQGSK